MNYAGVIHDIRSNHSYGMDGKTVRIVIKTPVEACHHVKLYWVDKYLYERATFAKNIVNMVCFANDNRYAYHEAIFTSDSLNINYFFELSGADPFVYFGNNRFFSEEITEVSNMYHLAAIFPNDHFAIPEWAKGAVIYQIFPDRFSHTEKETSSDWYQKVDSRSFLDGNLKGILAKLDYLASLHIDAIYLTPIFKSESNHRYDTIDYYEIDERLGNKNDLHNLVVKAKEKGINIILDMVFNHTGYDFFAFENVREKGQLSPYKDWYFMDGDTVIENNETLPNYKTFGYFYGMPKVNLDHKDAENYFVDVAKYWVEHFGIKGIRIDVADEMSPRFLSTLRKEIKALDPEVLIIGEIWYDSQFWLQGDSMDTVMNYMFYDGVRHLLNHQISTKGFFDNISYFIGNYKKETHHVLWNLIGSHDTKRFKNEIGKSHRKHILGLFLQVTLPGSPMIYYGDDIGLEGERDPDNRRGMIWDPDRRDESTYAFYKKMLSVYRHEKALKLGDFIPDLEKSDDELLVFRRVYGDEELTIYVNLSSKSKQIEKSTGKYDVLQERMLKEPIHLNGLTGCILKTEKDNDNL